MQFEARMTRQPAFNDRMLMGGVIIQNDVDALAQRNFAVDLLEEFQPLAVGVFLGGASDDFALLSAGSTQCASSALPQNVRQPPRRPSNYLATEDPVATGGLNVGHHQMRTATLSCL